MPTLRERPSRGEISPAKKTTSTLPATPTKARKSSALETSSASMAGGEIEVRESIEAKGDLDTEMNDAPDAPGAPNHLNADALGDVDADGEIDAEADSVDDADADGEPDDEAILTQDDSKDLTGLIKDTSEYLCAYKINLDGEEHMIASGFQRLVNKRSLPDYFEVIKEPIAFSTIRAKYGKKLYSSFKEFVRDVTLICHNAQVYNRPSAQYFKDAAQLLDVFKGKLGDIVKQGEIAAEEAEIPDLGPLPEFEDSPPPDEGEEEEDEGDEEDEDEDEDEDDTDDEGGRRRGRRRARKSGGRREMDEEDDPHKKRGRPPKVFTPLEARIYALIKGVRKFKGDDGHVRIAHFEKIPDKAEAPDYHETIKEPMALDVIKKKHRRKKYASMDACLADFELMFENAKTYNEEGSVIYDDAEELLKQVRLLAAQEKAKPDEEFRDGNMPLAQFEHRGETWHVGDWIHIINPNDPRHPIVAQIFKIWSDPAGQKWVNACWYYRPEQTVHRFDKHFYEHEVAKTGRYRDHRIEDIEDRCFVMFHTRFFKGRPRGFPSDKAVYVCEARYNEETHKFNRIKTWASCLPDEVRDRDYVMDLFDVARMPRKLPSPIKHLLQADSKETDPLPKPTWGSPNAPPIIGAVHRRPREANESPPPETHQPPQIPPAPISLEPSRRPSVPGDVVMSGTPGYRPSAVPVASPAPSAQFLNTSHFVPRPPAQSAPQASAHLTPMPSHVTHHQPQMQSTPAYTQYQQHQFVPQTVPPPHAYQPSGQLANTYDHRSPHPAPGMSPARPSMVPTANTAAMPPTGNQYNIPRPPEVYTLADMVDAAIPQDLKLQFKRDDNGRVLFFTAPPLDRPRKGLSEQHGGLGHSASHLANIHKIREERHRKRKERDESTTNNGNGTGHSEVVANKRQVSLKPHATSPLSANYEKGSQLEEQGIDTIIKWIADFSRHMLEGNAIIEQEASGWKEMKEQIRKENSGKTSEDLQGDTLRWFFDQMEKDGHLRADQRKLYEDVYIRHEYQREINERDNTDFLIGNRHAWEKKYGAKHAVKQHKHAKESLAEA